MFFEFGLVMKIVRKTKQISGNGAKRGSIKLQAKVVNLLSNWLDEIMHEKLMKFWSGQRFDGEARKR